MLRSVFTARNIAAVRVARYATATDKTAAYLTKELPVNVDDIDQKRFLRDIHPKIVQSKAFEKTAVSTFRLGVAQHHEGQHPEITKAIDEATRVDTQLESLFSHINEDDPLRRATSHFEYGNYRKDDEDSLLKMQIDWDFYRQVVPDASFIDYVKENYEQCVEDVYQEAAQENPIMDDLSVFERFAVQMVSVLIFFFFVKLEYSIKES